MKTVTLTLRYSPTALRHAEAWLITGNHPATWIEEVAQWDVRHAKLRFLPIPRSPHEQECCGVLVLPESDGPTRPSRQCVPFGCLVSRLYLPVDAWLDPDVSDRELSELLSEDYTYVWHPSCGLTAFEPDDIRRISDLISFPSQSSRQWSFAQTGLAFTQRLVSLLPEHSMTIENIVEAGRDDIGSQSAEISELPRSPIEPNPGLFQQATFHGLRLAAALIHRMTQLAPSTSNTPTWINHLEDWAQKHLAAALSGIYAARNKEIARLLHMLETDPDKGLRFALPLGGDAHRGVAPPGSQLSEQTTDFNLSRLGGGRPTDFWDLPVDFQTNLHTKYRQLANREIQLGRHRRAAYIFAELLADYHAAASALVSGRYWREAAVLYRSRLNSLGDAARCLEEGGLWTESIALYEEMQRYEKCGDLYLKLAQRENADAFFRKAVKSHLAIDDRISSARLLEQKLNAVDEAIDTVASGWPESRQATQCLRELFKVFGRLGRHEQAREWLRGFRENTLPTGQSVELTSLLADTAKGYPDELTRTLAADGARSLISRQLPNASSGDCRKLVSVLSRLVPEDRLLARDCQRFLQRAKSVYTRSAPAERADRVRRLHTIQIPGAKIRWKTAVASGHAILAVGQTERGLKIARCNWADLDQIESLRLPIELAKAPVLLASDPHFNQHDHTALLHVVDGPMLQKVLFSSTDMCPFETQVGYIRGMSSGVIGAAIAAHGFTWLLEMRDGQLTLIVLDSNGQHLATYDVPFPQGVSEFDESPSMIPIPMHARANAVYIGLFNQLLIFDQDKPMKSVDFSQRITALTGSAPNTRTRIAVSFDRGGVICWDDYEGEHVESFAYEMESPMICMNHGGYLIAAGDECCEIYSTDSRSSKLRVQLSDAPPNPVSVLSGPRMDQFAILNEQGEIVVYELQ